MEFALKRLKDHTVDWKSLLPERDLALTDEEAGKAIKAIVEDEKRQALLPWLGAIDSIEEAHKVLTPRYLPKNPLSASQTLRILL